MKIKKDSIKYFIVGILVIIFCFALSWFATCCVIKIAALLFNVAFSFKVATGIWLILCLINGAINQFIKNSKKGYKL